MSTHLYNSGMKISLREFSRNPGKYVDTLPIDLTIYGKCVATIVPFEKNVSSDSKKVSTDIKKVTTQRKNVTTQSVARNESVDTNVPTEKKQKFEEVKKEVAELESSFDVVRAVPKPSGTPKKKTLTPFRFSKPGDSSSLGTCQAQECKSSAVDAVMVATTEGEDIMKRLCKFHSANAKKERGY